MTGLDKIKRVFEFRSYTIEQLELSIDPERMFRKDEEIELRTFLGRSQVLSGSGDTGVVRLFCRIQSDFQDEDTPTLLLSLTLQGLFGFNDEEELPVEVKKELLDRNAVSVLFPYLRSTISSVTQAAGIQPIVLPIINPAAIDEVSHSPTDSVQSASDSE